ncbi:MAG TPA: pitrilysin family protein [Gemmatales bacterium]|nr:pitrilysin family protein [Gemmatales bacterium]
MRRLLFFSLALLAPCWALAQQPTKVTTVEGITEYRLDNGCKVLLYPDNSRSTVTVALTVFVGSRHEGYGETGMAHLLEHMVFKGTPTNKNIPKSLQNHGANFNGTTNVDRTNYFETMPANDENLEFGIQLEADRLVNSLIRREDLMSEFSVVRSEFESGENSPTRVLNQRMMAVAYEWHNYGKSTIGNRTDIERVPVDNLREFYKKFYQPDNCMIVIAGKFDEAKALILVQKYFGSIKKPTRELPKTYTEEPPQDGERLVTLRRVGDVGAIGVLYHIPAGRHADYPALEVMAQTMTAPPSGILYQKLVETKLVTSAGGFAQGLHDPGVIEFSAQVSKGVETDKVRDVLLDTIDEVVKNGLSSEDINRTKTRILKNRENASANTSQIAVGLSGWAAQGDWRLYFLHRDRIEKVTEEDVKAVAARYLKRDNRTLGVFIPTKEPQRSTIAAAPAAGEIVEGYKGRAAVAMGEAFNASPSNIDARTKSHDLTGGAKGAVLVKKNKGEQVTAIITIRYGNEENLKGMENAAAMLSPLMMRGTKKMSYQELRDEMDKLGVNIGGGFGGGGGGGRRGGGGGGGGSLGSLSITVSARKNTLLPALDLLQQILREPLLPEKEFETMIRGQTSMISGMKDEPQALVANRLSRMLSPYSKDDIRYVPTIEESLERLQHTNIGQVRKLQAEYLGAENATAVVVGDCDEAAVVQRLNELFKDWKASQPYAKITRPQVSSKDAVVEKINTPDKANAVFVAGLELPMRDDDEEYPALMMANYIFGGSGTLSSRLGDRIRQKEGISYGVNSSLVVDPLEKRGSFRITGICNPTNMEKFEKCVREELDRMIKEGISEKELDEARQGWLNAQMARFVQDGAIAGTLGNNIQFKRTMAYYSEQESKVRNLTAPQIGEAFKKYIDPKKLQVVEGGDFNK